jgi:hypothetical protein
MSSGYPGLDNRQRTAHRHIDGKLSTESMIFRKMWVIERFAGRLQYSVAFIRSAGKTTRPECRLGVESALFFQSPDFRPADNILPCGTRAGRRRKIPALPWISSTRIWRLELRRFPNPIAGTLCRHMPKPPSQRLGIHSNTVTLPPIRA